MVTLGVLFGLICSSRDRRQGGVWWRDASRQAVHG